MKSSRKSIIKALFSVSGLVILGKLLGFIKQAVSAGYFGATAHTDIISLSEGIITDVDYLLVQTLITAFIPVYIGIKQKDEKKSWDFVSNTLLLFSSISIVLVLLIEIFAGVISKVIAPSYSSELTGMLAGYVRFFAPVLIIIVLLALFNALLKANSHFIPGECISLVQSVITIILTVAIGRRVGPDVIAIAFFSYSIVNFMFLAAYSKRYWKFEMSNPFKDENVFALLRIMGPMMFGYAMIYINQQVDKIIVSGLEPGTITSMHYAAALSNFITAFIGSTCSVIFTHIADNVSKGNDKRAVDLVNNFGIVYTTVLFPISILTIFNAKDIVTIVFGRGAFDKVAVNYSTDALIGYAFMFVPLIFRELFSRFQYAYQDSKKPMINSSIGISVNIVLSILLSRWWGVRGVTFATSVSVFVTALLNVASARQLNADLSFKSYLRYLFFWLAGGAVCFVFTKIGSSILADCGPIVRFLAITLVSLVIYGVIMFFALLPVIKKIKRKNEYL